MPWEKYILGGSIFVIVGLYASSTGSVSAGFVVAAIGVVILVIGALDYLASTGRHSR